MPNGKTMPTVLLGLALVWGGTLESATAQDLRLVGAAADQDARTVRALLNEGVDVNATRGDGATALLWAAHWDDLETAEVLLRADADPNAADDHGVTPLGRAAENASAAMVETLLRAGADPNVAQTSGLTPLMIAAQTGDSAVVERLMEAGATVDAKTKATQSTALMWAVSESHRDIVRRLLDGGANPHSSTENGFTPLLYAAANGDIEVGEMLLAAGVGVDETGTDGTHALPYAIISQQEAFALFLLNQGADPDGAMGGIRALHAVAGSVSPWLNEWARQHGETTGYLGGRFGRRALPPESRLTLMRALLSRGADPNAPITVSDMFMSYIGYPKKGAFEPFSCGTGDIRGATPLWVATYAANVTPNVNIVRVLLAGGADQHLTTDDGTTPLMVAAGLGRCTFRPREPRGNRSESAEETVQALLDAGADINAVNEADFTALHGATLRGLNEVVRDLVERGADINARDFRGRTPFRMAEGAKQSFQFQAWPKTAELLRELGANTRWGIPGTVQERLRDVQAATNQ